MTSHRGTTDAEAAHELLLYLDNDPALYRQKQTIAANLLRKVQKRTYSHREAPAAWAYAVEQAAKKYAREYADPKDWGRIFNVPTRNAVARDLADRWYANAKAGRPGEV